MLKKLVGAAAALTIAAAGVGLSASIAVADDAPATTVPLAPTGSDQGVVRSGDIERFEKPAGANYTVWHDGATSEGAAVANGRFTTTTGGLLVEGKTQIIKGETVLPTADKILAYAQSSRIVATGAPVWHQIGFGLENGTWTTLRVVAGQESGPWTTSKQLGAVAANGSAPLEQLLAGVTGGVKYLSGGFYVDTNERATVQSYSVNGVTTSFQPAKPTVTSTTTVLAPQIRPDETEYAGWHNGAQPGGRYVTTPAGLAIQGKVQLLNGGVGVSSSVAEFVSTLALEGPDNVHYQVPVTFGTSGFTTLRATEAQRAQNIWTTSRAFGPYSASETDTIENFALALGEHSVIGSGFFVDEGQQAVVQSFTALDKKVTFAGQTSGIGRGFEPGTLPTAPANFVSVEQGASLPVNAPAGVFDQGAQVEILAVPLAELAPETNEDRVVPFGAGDDTPADAVKLGELTSAADTAVAGTVLVPADLAVGKYALLLRGGQTYPGAGEPEPALRAAAAGAAAAGAAPTYVWAADGVEVSEATTNGGDPEPETPAKPETPAEKPAAKTPNAQQNTVASAGSEPAVFGYLLGGVALVLGAGLLVARRFVK